MVTAMVMAMITHMINKMIDVHTHIMYGVDDGSKDLKMTKEMLSMCCSQGVDIIFLTPHINPSSSEQKSKEYNNKFNEISFLADSFGIKCYLGAEIYLSFRLPDIDFEKYTMGKSNALLIEFSTMIETPVLDHSYNLIKKGFKVIIAHAERYDYLSLEDIVNLKNMGALIQVNASSLIKKGKSKHLKRSWTYIKNDLVDFVASDSHNITSRIPNMNNAYKILSKKINEEKLNDLFFKNALKYLI
jgi:protein-tyrosine phosphatase